jgi:hypothetical protein
MEYAIERFVFRQVRRLALLGGSYGVRALMLEAVRWAAAARLPTLPGLPCRRSAGCPFGRAESE